MVCKNDGLVFYGVVGHDDGAFGDEVVVVGCNTMSSVRPWGTPEGFKLVLCSQFGFWRYMSLPILPFGAHR